MQTNWFDQTFRDSDGKIVIGQMPNLPLWVWIAATLFNVLPTYDAVSTILSAIAFGSLFTWAWEELFQGVNYF